MKKLKTSWSYIKGNEPDVVKKILSGLSLRVRRQQFGTFLKIIQPKKEDKVVDIGVSSVEPLPDINFFEKNYPYLEKLTAVSIDALLDFKKKYPKIKFVQVIPDKPLPFADNTFNIVVSWATLEHVGDKKQQEFFLKEIFRIGKKIFVTTPYRGCPYEPHSGLFFVHWLPRKWFEKICRFLGKSFWASEKNLRCLWKKELEELLPDPKKTKILTYKIFGLIPSHLMIFKT